MKRKITFLIFTTLCITMLCSCDGYSYEEVDEMIQRAYTKGYEDCLSEAYKSCESVIDDLEVGYIREVFSDMEHGAYLFCIDSEYSKAQYDAILSYIECWDDGTMCNLSQYYVGSDSLLWHVPGPREYFW